MAIGGAKIYCPKCKAFQVCKVISPTKIGQPKARRWHRVDYKDIAWFRRGGICSECERKFLTAEIDEDFIQELVELKRRLAEKQKVVVGSLRKKILWLKREETIPLDVAEGFIRESACWLTHSSGSPVRAPRHADRIYKSHHGWALDFGANTFLVGKAVERCRNEVNNFLDSLESGRIPLRSELIASLKKQISGAVANAGGYEYSGCYPVEGRDLIFGVQSIDLSDGANFIIRESGIGQLLLNE